MHDMEILEKMREDLEMRNINYQKWIELTQDKKFLVHKLKQCYMRHNSKRAFNEELHRCGVKLRVDKFCRALLAEYPDLENKN